MHQRSLCAYLVGLYWYCAHEAPSSPEYEPMEDEVELTDVNPEYAHVRLPDGWETTV